MSSPSPGWYPDPTQRGFERFWDGQQWTDMQVEVSTPSTDPHAAHRPATAANTAWQGSTTAPVYSDLSVPTRRRRGQGITILLTSVAVTVGVLWFTGTIGNRGQSDAEPAPYVSSYAEELDLVRSTDSPAAASADALPADYPRFGTTELERYLEEALLQEQPRIDLSSWVRAGADNEEILAAARKVRKQNPYIYIEESVSTTFKLTNTGNNGAGALVPTYTYAHDEAELRRAATLKGTAMWLEHAGLEPGMSDVEIATAIHDVVAASITYDYDALADLDADRDTLRAMRSQDPYGAYADGIALCAGYAEAFHLLATAAGLESEIIHGDAPGGPHAWNQVRIDGEWLIVDVTWSDSGDAGGQDYLLLDPRDSALSGRTVDAP